LFGEPKDKLSENEDDDLTSEDEVSDDGDPEDEPAENVNRRYHRRRTICAVSSIATSFDQTNYDMLDLEDAEPLEL